MDTNKLLEFKKSVEKEKDNLLNFWIENAVDEENDGFYGEIVNEGKVNFTADKSLILNTRILWSFSNAYREDKKEEYLAMAKRAASYLLNNFWDQEYGGFYWLLDYQGKVATNKKQIYGQAFAIYAFSEYYRVTGADDILTLLLDLFSLIEKYSNDKKYKGYFEACSRDWLSMPEDMSLSEKDMNVSKSMNTHLHILEAYTNFYRVCSKEELKDKLIGLIRIFLKYIIDNEKNCFRLFFDRDWNICSNIVSYGHDIEGSWLLCEAAGVLGSKDLRGEVEKTALKMAERVLKSGLMADGSIYYEFNKDNLNKDRHWWVQAEAVVGFINAYQLSGEEIYLNTALNTWQYIINNLVDREYGEWYWLINEQGSPSDEAKVNPWKSPYHNSRACYEIINRLTTILL